MEFVNWSEGTAAASVATLAALTVLSYLWWRSLEFARVKRFVRGGSGNVLPSPVPALPKWCGIFGGHALLLKKGKTVEQFERWAEELGGDYELSVGGTRIIGVSGLADIRRILTLRPSRFKRGVIPDQTKWASEQIGVKDSMFFEEGKEWGRSRRLISPHLNGHNVAAMIPVISKIGERFCAKIGKKADEGDPMAAREEFERFTHDVIALAVFGMDVDCTSATAGQASHSYDAIEVLTTAFGRLIRQPRNRFEWRFLPMMHWVRFTKWNARRLKSVVQGVIDAVRLEDDANISADKRDNRAGGTLLRRIIGATSARGGSNSDRMLLSDREVMHQATSLFIAGTETTALSLCWALYYLSKDREALLRCRAEALRVAPSSDGMVTASDQLAQLEFCSAVFKETLRLRTPAPLLALNCTEDFTLKSGFVLEQATGLIVLNRAAGTSDEFFTRGKEFVPERWIDAEREEALLGKGGVGSGKGSVAHEAEAILSFGHGPRICPGQDMAKAEGAIIIAAICARFDVSMAPGQDDPPEEVSTFTLGPKELDLIFTRRNKAGPD